MRVTKIIKDPNIQTISMSVLSLSGPNADFDYCIIVEVKLL